VNEAELRGRVTRECTRLRLLWHWCRDSRKCSGKPGLPDLIIAGRGGLLLAELKGPDGETRPGQDEWLATLAAGRSPWAVWYPVHWETGAIQQALQELANRNGR
jgi:hypothetical protein